MAGSQNNSVKRKERRQCRQCAGLQLWFNFPQISLCLLSLPCPRPTGDRRGVPVGLGFGPAAAAEHRFPIPPLGGGAGV